MAKKLCELCGKNYESDMRFGVKLCHECIDGYSKAMSGEVDAKSYFSNLQNFPNATEKAKINIIGGIAERNKRIEANARKKQQEELQKHQEESKLKEIEKKEHSRESYAKTIGITYKENIDNSESAVDGWYTDIGKKIKDWAKTIFIVEAIFCVVGAIGLLFATEGGEMIFVAIISAIIGPIIAWVSSWILYAFGELVDKTSTNERNTRNILKLMLENNAKESK